MCKLFFVLWNFRILCIPEQNRQTHPNTSEAMNSEQTEQWVSVYGTKYMVSNKGEVKCGDKMCPFMLTCGSLLYNVPHGRELQDNDPCYPIEFELGESFQPLLRIVVDHFPITCIEFSPDEDLRYVHMTERARKRSLCFPDLSLVTFIDGNRNNCAVDNLIYNAKAFNELKQKQTAEYLDSITWRSHPKFDGYEVNPRGEVRDAATKEKIEYSPVDGGVPLVSIQYQGHNRTIAVYILSAYAYRVNNYRLIFSTAGADVSYIDGDPRNCSADNLIIERA